MSVVHCVIRDLLRYVTIGTLLLHPKLTKKRKKLRFNWEPNKAVCYHK